MNLKYTQQVGLLFFNLLMAHGFTDEGTGGSYLLSLEAAIKNMFANGHDKNLWEEPDNQIQDDGDLKLLDQNVRDLYFLKNGVPRKSAKKIAYNREYAENIKDPAFHRKMFIFNLLKNKNDKN